MFQSISLYNEILESITPQDIQKAANYVFSTYPDYAIDANKEAIKKISIILTILQKTDKKVLIYFKYIFKGDYIYER